MGWEQSPEADFSCEESVLVWQQNPKAQIYRTPNANTLHSQIAGKGGWCLFWSLINISGNSEIPDAMFSKQMSKYIKKESVQLY